jgi:prevent-host-death family protein
MRIPLIRSITDLARDARNLVAEAQRTQQPIVITQRGREAAVLVPIDLYRRLESGRVISMPSLHLVNPEDGVRFQMAVDQPDEPNVRRVAEGPDASL